MTAGMAELGWGVLLVAGAVPYLRWALPRMAAVPAVAVTALLTLFLLFLPAWLGSSSALGKAARLGGVALGVGHLAWFFGRRSALPLAPARAAATPSPAKRSSRSPSPASAQPAATQPGSPVRTSLGRYRVESEIGRGAMGAVYLGRDPKIGRAVAIKTMALSKEFHGDELTEARQRFFREAETAGRLQHPDIVTIFDAGEDQDLAYIAMEFLTGHDLQRHTQSLLPVATVVRIGARVAEALGYAHSHGVVHRDIKPANVMVDLQADAVKVTDFGIARITDSSRTRTGMVLGTPSFMSPEQMSGRRVDGRSDLYSLGVMLYQLLTGQLPHRADSMATLMYEIANQPAPDIRNWRPEVPEALARTVATALEKRPELRHADGHQMGAELRAALALLPAADLAQATASGQVLPNSGAFDATVKINPADPGHNSTL
jgi:serine/threonine protein kinase